MESYPACLRNCKYIFLWQCGIPSGEYEDSYGTGQYLCYCNTIDNNMVAIAILFLSVVFVKIIIFINHYLLVAEFSVVTSSKGVFPFCMHARLLGELEVL